MSFVLRDAVPAQVDALLALYAEVYGASYPLAFGTDRAVALRTMAAETALWLVAIDEDTGRIGGSVVFDSDPLSKIGKCTGLVVSPELRGQNIASRLVSEGTRRLLQADGPLNSIYATTRTNSVGVQRIFLKDGFFPLGIFPNAHRLKEYETLTLFAKYRPGVLDRRPSLPRIPAELDGILAAIAECNGIVTEGPRQAPEPSAGGTDSPLEFEVIYAPNYVRRLFDEKMLDPYDRFFPFHRPNLLLTSTDGKVEIYAYFSKGDRYCAIVSLNVPVHTLDGRLLGLLDQLKELGVSYIELLLGLPFTRSIEAALRAGFVPSAMYPAMREADGEVQDFLILSRTLEPLNFRGMAIDRAFKPFIDQYVRLWTEKHLMTLEIYDTK